MTQTGTVLAGGPYTGPADFAEMLPAAASAMRADPVPVNGVEIYRPGTLLGKALEPLAAGRAAIRVLLLM